MLRAVGWRIRLNEVDAGGEVSVVVFYFQLFAHIEIVVETVVVDIDETEAFVGGRYLQLGEQVPLGFAEIVGATVEDDAVRHVVEGVVSTAYALVARLQEVAVLADHSEAEHTVHGDDKLG